MAMTLKRMRDEAFKSYRAVIQLPPDEHRLANASYESLRCCISRGMLFNIDDALGVYPPAPPAVRARYWAKETKHPFSTYAVSYVVGDVRWVDVVALTDPAGAFAVASFGCVDHNGIGLVGSIHTLGPSVDYKGDMAAFALLPSQVSAAQLQGVKNQLGGSLCLVYTFLNVLSDSRSTQTIVYPDKKQQQLRAMLGRPKLGSYTQVEFATPVENKDSDVLKHGGTHASPIPHERRGHYVTRGVKTYWRRSCTVNAKVGTPGAPGLPARTHYEVSV